MFVKGFKEGHNRFSVKKMMLICLSLLLSLNIVTSAVPFSVFAGTESVDSFDSLCRVAESCAEGESVTIKIAASIPFDRTITLQSGADVILSSASGSYTLSRANGFEGDMFVLSSGASLTLKSGVIFDGKGAESSAPFISVDSSAELTIDGAVLQNNYNRSYKAKGGAVVCDGGSVIMDSGKITGCRSYYNGGAVSVLGSGSFTMNGGEISGNVAETGNGGGIMAAASDGNAPSVAINSGVISGNNAVKGGGMYLDGCQTATIAGSGSSADASTTKITSNTADMGAGVYYANKPVSGTNYLVTGNVQIIGNTLTGRALPNAGDACNVFIEDNRSGPEFDNRLSTFSNIGLYPYKNNTSMNSATDYINNSNVFSLDHHGDVVSVSYANGKITVKSSATVAVSFTTANGSIKCVNGDAASVTTSGMSVYAGLPVQLKAVGNEGYTLAYNGFYVYLMADDSVIKSGNATDGLWHTFTAGGHAVKADFAEANVVAKVDGINFTSLSDAVAYCAGNPDSEITVVGNAVLDSTIVLDKCEHIELTAASAKTIKRANGFTGAMFELSGDAQLKLTNLTLDGGALETTPVTADAPLITVADAELIISSGTTLTNNNNANGNGGAVFVDGGTLNMAGGMIRGNTAANGGAVYVYGNGAIVSTASSKGLMTANTANQNGGGVYIASGHADGIDLTANTATVNGGGAYIANGELVNSVVGGDAAKANTAADGSGVYAQDARLENVTVSYNKGASGVYADSKLTLAGSIIIDNNKTSDDSTEVNLKIDNASSSEVSPIYVEGRLEDGSSVMLTLTDTTSVGKTVVRCSSELGESEDVRTANAESNATFFGIENTGNTLALLASGMDIVTASAASSVTVKPAAGTGAQYIEMEPSAEFKMDKDGEGVIIVKHLESLDIAVETSLSYTVTTSETADENGMLSSVYTLTVPTDATASVFDFTVTADANYNERTLKSGEVNYCKTFTEYFGMNEALEENTDGGKTEFSYTAASLHPYAELTAEFIPNTDSRFNAIKNEMDEVKPDGVTILGVVALTPTLDQELFAGVEVLPSATQVKTADIGVYSLGFRDNNDTIDIISYNGSAARLHDDVVVTEDWAYITVDRSSTGGNTVYLAVLSEADDEVQIGSKKYHTLRAALEKADDGDTITLLRDVTVHSTMYVPANVSVTITSKDNAGYTIKRGENLTSNMFYIDYSDALARGGKLKLQGVNIDGGGELVYGVSDVQNRGISATASAIANHGELEINGVNITDCCNSLGQISSLGGAIYNAVGSKAAMANSTISGCGATSGGAVYNLGEFTMNSGSMENNYATSDGGAINNTANGTFSMTGGSIANNVCRDPQKVGGVANYGIFEVADSASVISNTAGYGNSSRFANVGIFGRTPIVIEDGLNADAKFGICFPDEEMEIIAESTENISALAVNFFPDVCDLEIIPDSTNKMIVLGDTEDEYHDVLSSAGENGVISPNGEIRVSDTADQTYVIVPDAGYAIADVLVDNASVLEDVVSDSDVGGYVYDLEDVEADHTVAVTFKEIPGNKITAVAGTNGAITPTSATVNSTEEVTFTITPASGYYLSELTVGAENVTDDAVYNATTGVYTYTMSGVTEDVPLSATFDAIYTTRRLTDTASGVEINGSSIHKDAVLTVSKLTADSSYNQLKAALGKNEYIHSAYDIKLTLPNGEEYNGFTAFKNNISISFSIGTSYSGESAKVFHLYNGSVDKTSHSGTVTTDGVLSVNNVTSLSPFGVVFTQKVSTNTTPSSTDQTNPNGTTTIVDTGDSLYYVTLAFVILIFSACAVVFVVRMHYIPRLIKWIRQRRMA